jgi:hypothetical protein
MGDSGGAEIAEFAIVLPILLTVIFAMYSFGRAYNIYTTITRAAQEGAEIAAVPSTCAACPTPGAPPCSGGPATTYPNDTCVANTVTSILQASRIDPAQIQVLAPTVPTTAASPPPLTAGTATPCVAPAPPPSCAATNNITVCRNVVLNPTSTVQECGTVVSFQYHYQLSAALNIIPGYNLSVLDIPVQAETRMEY